MWRLTTCFPLDGRLARRRHGGCSPPSWCLSCLFILTGLNQVAASRTISHFWKSSVDNLQGSPFYTDDDPRQSKCVMTSLPFPTKTFSSSKVLDHCWLPRSAVDTCTFQRLPFCFWLPTGTPRHSPFTVRCGLGEGLSYEVISLLLKKTRWGVCIFGKVHSKELRKTKEIWFS